MSNSGMGGLRKPARPLLVASFVIMLVLAFGPALEYGVLLPPHSALAAAASLSFTTQPANTTSGTAFAQAPVVRALNPDSTIDTTYNASVSIAIKPGTGTAGAALFGTTQVNAVSGVATFNGLSVDKAGVGYVLVASSGQLMRAESAAFEVAPGVAHRLAFITQPSKENTVNVALGTQPVVVVQDVNGNIVTSSSATVALAITSGTGTAGAALLPVSPVANAVNGVASFTGLRITAPGAGFTLTATSTGLASAVSVPFNVAGTAARLAFTAQPSISNTAGAALGTQPRVTVQDANGNTVTNSAATLTLAITAGTGTSGAALAGTVAVNAVNGVATFAGLSINKAGTGYTLTATSAGLISAASAAFDVAPGAANRLAFSTQPSVENAAGIPLGRQPVVTVQDAHGNTVVTSTAAVTLGITGSTNTVGAVLSGALTVNAANGVASFSGLSLDRVSQGYTLTATSGTLTAAVSGSFNVAGPAMQLAFTMFPGGGTGGTPWAVQPVVAVLDANGSTVTTSAAPITLAITSGTGVAGATLSGTVTVNAVGGVATFNDLNIDKAAQYKLTAASGTLAQASSPWFTVASGPAAKLLFTTQPSASNAVGVAFAQQPVASALDAGGNSATGFQGTVALAITPGTGTNGATLSGVVTVAAVNGVATFTGLSVDKVGTSYALTASSTGLISATSSAFNVTGAGPVTSVTLYLVSGWNLVSLPLIPSTPTIATVLAPVAANLEIVWSYDAATRTWLSYAPGAPSDLMQMTDGKAYWVNMRAAASLVVAGSELSSPPNTPPAYSVVPGWNFIGFKSTVVRTVGDYLAGIAGRYTRVYSYANGQYFALQSTDLMTPGLGYWVAVTSSGTIYP